jgi:hypothetical protein
MEVLEPTSRTKRLLHQGRRRGACPRQTGEQAQLMAGKEPQLEPAEDLIHDRLGEADVFIAGPAGGLKTVVGELLGPGA